MTASGVADPAGAAGLDRHVAERHARLHVHGVDHRAVELDDAVGGAVHADAADDGQDDVLGEDARRAACR